MNESDRAGQADLPRSASLPAQDSRGADEAGSRLPREANDSSSNLPDGSHPFFQKALAILREEGTPVQIAAASASPPPAKAETEPQQIPARMLNEFVYCQRLFYYEFVEGVFVESVDTLRGEAIHKRVDSGNGALPAARKKAKKPAPDESAATVDVTTQASEAQSTEAETIHSRSVQMGSPPPTPPCSRLSAGSLIPPAKPNSAP